MAQIDFNTSIKLVLEIIYFLHPSEIFVDYENNTNAEDAKIVKC